MTKKNVYKTYDNVDIIVSMMLSSLGFETGA